MDIVEKLTNVTTRMNGLFKELNPGLATWNMMVRDEAKEFQNLVVEMGIEKKVCPVSEEKIFDTLVSEVSCLNSLVQDKQEGLRSWNMMVGQTVSNISSLLDASGIPVPKM